MRASHKLPDPGVSPPAAGVGDDGRYAEALSAQPADSPVSGGRGARTGEEWISLVRVLVLLTLIPALWFGIIPVAHLATNGIMLLLGGYVILLAVGPRLLPLLRKADLVIVLDILVITLVVLISGILSSPFRFLYYLTILEAAARLNLRQAFAASMAMAGIIIILWTRAGGGETLETAGFRLGAFIAGGFFLALFLGMLVQEQRANRERVQWTALLGQRLREATQQLEEQLDELQFYNDLAGRLSGELRVKGVLEILLRVFLKTTGLPRGAAYIYGEDDEPHFAAAEEGVPGANGGQPEPVPLPTLLQAPSGGEVLIQPILSNNGQPDECLMCVPLMRAGSLRAWLCGQGDASHTLTDDVRRRLRGVATQGVSALEAARLHEQIRTLADTDPLTGLANRRCFLERLVSELARSRRKNYPLSVAIIDLDGFKAINDAHGHSVGDSALVRVAKSLAHTVRAFDLSARFGGDEFILLFPETTGAAAEEILCRFRGTEVSVPDGRNGTLRLSFSWGTAEWPQDGSEPDRLLRVADRRLYEMKQRLQVEDARRST